MTLVKDGERVFPRTALPMPMEVPRPGTTGTIGADGPACTGADWMTLARAWCAPGPAERRMSESASALLKSFVQILGLLILASLYYYIHIVAPARRIRMGRRGAVPKERGPSGMGLGMLPRVGPRA